MLVRVDVLGRFRVAVDGRVATAAAWRRTRSAALVKLLALAEGHRLHREQVMEALWPDLEPEAAAANLRKAAHFVRRALDAHDVVVLDGEIVALAPGAELVIDSQRFEAAAKAALRRNDASACEQAAGLYGGDLLPDDRYTEWAEEPRERLRQLHMQVLRKACLWEQVVAADPVDEEAQRELMQASLDAGNRGEVIRQFQRLRERLRVDLGLGPAAATIALYEKALTPAGAESIGVVDRVRGLLAWGIVHLNSGDFANAEQTAKEARALAFDAELGREVGEATALFGLVAHMQGRWQELFRSEFVGWVRGGSPFVSKIFDGHLCLAEFCLCGSASHEGIASATRELLAVAEEAGSVPGRALATLVLGEAELFSGRLDSAEALLTAADRLHADADAAARRALSLQRLAEVALARGQKWRAGRLVRQGLKIAEPTWLAPHLLMRLQGAAVEAATSEALAADAIRLGDRWLAERNMCQPCSMGFRVASSIALAEAGELDQASRRLNDAERLAGMWQGGPWVAAVWEARGVHRRAQGDDEQASALFREAASRYAELGRPHDQERCLARSRALRPVEAST
jgi:DNA-binding SARP family transcriptional activator